MKISKLLFIRQCDIKGCKHIANYGIMYDDKNPRTTMCICNDCLENLAKCYKSVQPTKKVSADTKK